MTTEYTFDPNKYGLKPTLDVDFLVTGVKARNELVNAIKGKAETESVEVELTDEDWANFQPIQNVTTTVWESLIDSPALAEMTIRELERILKDLRDYRDWYKADLARKGKPTLPVDLETKIRDARKLEEMVTAAFIGLRPMIDSGLITLPEGFKVKDSKTKGKVPEFEGRIPDPENGGTRKVASRLIRWSVSGVDVPEGTFLDEVAARYVSSVNVRVTREELERSIPRKPSTGTKSDGSPRKGSWDLPTDGSRIQVMDYPKVVECWLPVENQQEVETVEEDESEED